MGAQKHVIADAVQVAADLSHGSGLGDVVSGAFFPWLSQYGECGEIFFRSQAGKGSRS